MAAGSDSDGAMQDIALECSVCAELYADNFDHFPRVLRCGHTFCTRCLLRIMTARSVKCPMCNAEHRLTVADINEVPPNYAVIQIVSPGLGGPLPVDSAKTMPLCEYCGEQPASLICQDCSAGSQVKFCHDCDRKEHNRPFPPVQRHKRIPLDSSEQSLISSEKFIRCSIHFSNEATLFSLELKQFACPDCKLNPDLADKIPSFDDISTITRVLRGRARKMNQYSREVTEKLAESQQNLLLTVQELSPSLAMAKSQIQDTFAEIMDILQERQQELLRSVDDEYRERKSNLERQLTRVQEARREFIAGREDLNTLMQKSNLDFLLRYDEAITQLNKLLGEEDRSLQRPVAHHDIPIYIPMEILSQLKAMGAVGGGAMPVEITCVPSSARTNLMQLEWQLSSNPSGNVVEYEVEYECVPQRVSGRIASGDPNRERYLDTDPHYIKLPGSVLTAYIDGLCPSYQYRFRIRAKSLAGWGMWSTPVVGTCADFPITACYTQKVHQVRIPNDGFYRITAAGAKAQDGIKFTGGKGAIISAVFPLKANDKLILLSGGMSQRNYCNSGGGGGSFVALNKITQETLLIAAGGGGGTRGLDDLDAHGCDANLESWGTDGRGVEHGCGGKDGSPGEDADMYSGPSWGCGGAGFLQDSKTAKSFLNGAAGGQSGGFGGGGGVGLYGGGGGGGYSGGGGGRGGGGGGSYVRQDGQEVEKKIGSEGHGSIVIEEVGEPRSVFTRTISPSGVAVGLATTNAGMVSNDGNSGYSTSSATPIPPGSTATHSSVSSSASSTTKRQISSSSSSTASVSVFGSSALPLAPVDESHGRHRSSITSVPPVRSQQESALHPLKELPSSNSPPNPSSQSTNSSSHTSPTATMLQVDIDTRNPTIGEDNN